MRWILVALIALFAFPSAAMAWGNPGHATVCQVAYLRLTSTARHKVDQLVDAGPYGKSGNTRRTTAYPTFAQSCTFPDNPHERGDEHFVNYERTLSAVTATTLCSPGLQCLYSAIEQDVFVLSANQLSPLSRAAALFHIGHWIGDLHQPLHVSFGDDFGGGGVKTTGVCGTDGLHSVWDKCIVESMFRNLRTDDNDSSAPQLPTTNTTNQWNNARTAGTYLNGKITAQMASQWLASRQPWQWAAESYAIARQPDVSYCIDRGAQGCWYSPTARKAGQGVAPRTVAITATYVSDFRDDVRLRIQQAGVRLAHMLNDALDPSYSG